MCCRPEDMTALVCNKLMDWLQEELEACKCLSMQGYSSRKEHFGNLNSLHVGQDGQCKCGLAFKAAIWS